MVNVTHYGNNRSSRLQILLAVLKEFKTFFLNFLLNLGHHYADSQLVCQNENCILVYILIDVGHDTHLHECHDNL